MGSRAEEEFEENARLTNLDSGLRALPLHLTTSHHASHVHSE